MFLLVLLGSACGPAGNRCHALLLLPRDIVQRIRNKTYGGILFTDHGTVAADAQHVGNLLLFAVTYDLVKVAFPVADMNGFFDPGEQLLRLDDGLLPARTLVVVQAALTLPI